MQLRRFAALGLVTGTLFAPSARSQNAAPPHPSPLSGAAIYQDQCARCHGPQGQGVAGQCDEPLYGERSVELLARQIARTMPEDREEKCPPDQALAVAAYIHDAFYSPQARARQSPPRRDLSRLTTRQYRESVADLLASFRPIRQTTRPGGLRAEYFQSEGMNKKHKKILERTDLQIAFDLGEHSPAENLAPDQFSIAWEGSLLAPDTGLYEFRIATPNGARLYLNTDLAAGDSNRRDDSDAKRQPALIDLWVSSGGMVREATATAFLLGGRSYPLRLDYFKFKEKTAALEFAWKPPHGPWAAVPTHALSPDRSSPVPVIATTFPPDDASTGYERGASVSKAWLEAVTKAAVEAADQVVQRLPLLSGTGDRDVQRAEKWRTFCQQLAERAFRQPLTPEQRATYVDAHFTQDLPPESAVKRSVLLILSSPHFLYPDPAGAPADYTAAARLALALWDSLPDAELRTAAARGELRTREQIHSHATRMLDDPRTRAKLRQFFHHWLAADEADDLTKDPHAYPEFSPAVLADLRDSLDLFVEDIVWSQSSDYRALLSADYLYLNQRLAPLYGAPTPAEPGFQRIPFDPARRAGIFTHPFLLTTFSYHKSSSPIHRGVFLTRNVLGRFLKPPPMAIEFMDDRFDPNLTMREKVTQLTAKDACMACHATINPLGFSLEHYDAVGRFRTLDNNQPVNAESDYTTSDGETLRLRGPRDVAQHALTSPEARRGFVRQLFQQTVKQAPAAYGLQTLDRLDAAFVDAQYHIRQLLVEIATTAAQPATPTLTSLP